MINLVAIKDPFWASIPALMAGTEKQGPRRFLEFFTVNIRSRNTRAAYARSAVRPFLALLREVGGLTNSGASSRCLWPCMSSSCSRAFGSRGQATSAS